MSQFRKIPYIPTADKLADLVFSKLKRIRVDTPRKIKMRRSDLSFYKTLYFRQFRFIFPEFDTKLSNIANSFPFIDELHPFHKELIEVLFGIEKIRTSLSRIKNTRKSLRSIERDVSKKLGICEFAEEAKKIRREAIGRIGSTIKKIEQPLNDLIEAKIQLSKVPDFNLFEKTIVFAGAPNAGKSSYVKIVSTGKPEIAAPIARPSQLFFATFVDPRPGIIHGTRSLIFLSLPIRLSMFTFGNIALSLSASIPLAPTAVPIILK